MASSIRGDSNERLEDVVRNVQDVLNACKESGLEVEVLATALILIKENPTFDIEYSLHAALQDWDV